jgi:hypothetical protein
MARKRAVGATASAPPLGLLDLLGPDELGEVLSQAMQDRGIVSVPLVAGVAGLRTVCKAFSDAFDRASAPLQGRVCGDLPTEESADVVCKRFGLPTPQVVVERQGADARVEGGVRLESIPCADTGQVHYRPMGFHVVMVGRELRVYLRLGGEMWWEKSARRRTRHAKNVWLLRMNLWSTSIEMSGRSLGARPCTHLHCMLPYTRGSCRSTAGLRTRSEEDDRDDQLVLDVCRINPHPKPATEQTIRASDIFRARRESGGCTEALLREMRARDTPDLFNTEAVRHAYGAVCTPLSNDRNTAAYLPSEHDVEYETDFYSSRWGVLQHTDGWPFMRLSGGVRCAAYTELWYNRSTNKDPWKPFDGVVTVTADFLVKNGRVCRRALFSFDGLTALFGVNAPDSLYPRPVLPRWVVSVLRGLEPDKAERSTSFRWSGHPREREEDEEEACADESPWTRLYDQCVTIPAQCLPTWSMRHQRLVINLDYDEVPGQQRYNSRLPHAWSAISKFMQDMTRWTELERYEWLERPHYESQKKSARQCALVAKGRIAEQSAMERRLNTKGQELVQGEAAASSGGVDARFVASERQWAREDREERRLARRRRRADGARAAKERAEARDAGRSTDAAARRGGDGDDDESWWRSPPGDWWRLFAGDPDPPHLRTFAWQ